MHGKAKKIIVFLTIAVLLILSVTTAFYNALVVQEYHLTSQKLQSPVRLLVIADLHSTDFGEEQNDLTECILRQRPDAILYAGDIADDNAPHDATVTLLKNLQGKYPAYYVSGNHEYWSREAEQIKGMFRQYGVTVLEGTNAVLDVDGQKINLCGIDDPAGGIDMDLQLRQAVSKIDTNLYTVLLAHRPERIEGYLDYPFDLIVSGHTHGGQWRLPLVLNGLFAPDQGWFPKYPGGLYQHGSITHIISRGLATNVRYPRIFNPPEIVMIDLLPEDTAGK